MASKIKSRTKFRSVDVIAFMSDVVKKHLEHFESDFEKDKEILMDAANKQEQQDRTFVWLCRTAGTWCLHERDVFIKGTCEHNTFSFYAEQTREPILAFVIEVAGVVDGILIGNVYALDYAAYYNHVHAVSLKAETVEMTYEHGCRTKKADENIHSYPDPEYGKLQSMCFQPHSQDELTGLLWNERQTRKRFREAKPSEYLEWL